VEDHICIVVGDNLLFPAALTKGQTTTAFLRVLKYSTGGVLEVIFCFPLFSFIWDMLDFVVSFCGF
jgi:hypothetical protein